MAGGEGYSHRGRIFRDSSVMEMEVKLRFRGMDLDLSSQLDHGGYSNVVEIFKS